MVRSKVGREGEGGRGGDWVRESAPARLLLFLRIGAGCGRVLLQPCPLPAEALPVPDILPSQASHLCNQ